MQDNFATPHFSGQPSLKKERIRLAYITHVVAGREPSLINTRNFFVSLVKKKKKAVQIGVVHRSFLSL